MTEPQPPSAADGDPRDAASTDDIRVGVLLVHGMGQQERGDTLISFAQPLFGWIRDWSGQRNPYYATRILSSALRAPVLDEAEEPAHLVFEAVPTAPDQEESPPRSLWTLAESHWAGEFRDPPFGRLAGWMIGVGAWMILSHFGKFIRVRLTSWWRFVLGVPLLVAGVVLALLVQLLVATLAILAAVPVPRLRRSLSGLLRYLTGTLGDSYVLISSPVQEQAAVSRAQHDLRWLAKRSDHLFVVAHSQGAAIAHRALESGRSDDVCRLFTFGSGLGKLEELRLLNAADQRSFYLLVQVGLPLAAFALILLPRAIASAFDSALLAIWDAWVLLIFASPLFMLAVIVKNTWQGWRQYTSHVEKELTLPGVVWHDCYSTSDPVPNGPLVESGVHSPTVESTKVRNRASLLSDHSSYFENRDEFLTWLVSRIDADAGTGLVSPEEVEKLAPSARRVLRVRALLAMRWATLLSFVAVAIGVRDQLAPAADRYLWGPLTGLPELSWAGAVVQAVAGAVGALVRLVTGASPQLVADVGLNLLALAVLAVLALLSYALTVGVWRWWDQVQMDEFFGSSYPFVVTGGAPALTFLVGVVPTIFAVALISTGKVAGALDVVGLVLGWYLKILALLVLVVFAYMILIAGTYFGLIFSVALVLTVITKTGRLFRKR